MLQLMTEGRRETGRGSTLPTTGTAVTDLPSILNDGRIAVEGIRDRHYFLRSNFQTYLGEVSFAFVGAEIPGGILLGISGAEFTTWERAETVEEVLCKLWELARRATASPSDPRGGHAGGRRLIYVN